MAGKGNHGQHVRRSTDFPGGSQEHSQEQHEGLKETAQEMASHLGESTAQMKEKTREFVSGMAGQAQEAWHSAREGVQERFSGLSAKAGDIWEDGIEFVRRYPLASLCAAFVLGSLTSCALFALASRSTEDVAERMSRASS